MLFIHHKLLKSSFHLHVCWIFRETWLLLLFGPLQKCVPAPSRLEQDPAVTHLGQGSAVIGLLFSKDLYLSLQVEIAWCGFVLPHWVSHKNK
jgi:hypothetical protein